MKIAVFIGGSDLWLNEIPKIIIDVPIVPNRKDRLHLTDKQCKQLADKIWRITNPKEHTVDCEFANCFYGKSSSYFADSYPHREDLSVDDFIFVDDRIVSMLYVEKGIGILIELKDN